VVWGSNNFSISLDNLKNYIFDFDGTLVDSREGIISSFKKACNDNKIAPQILLNEENLVGPPLDQLIVAILGKEITKTKQELLRREFIKIYDKSEYKKTKSFFNLDSVLKRLKNNNKGLYIVTNKREGITKKILNLFGWSNLFIVVYGSDTFKKKLTKSQLINLLIEDMNIKRSESCYIGDRDDDKSASLENNLQFYYASWNEDCDGRGLISPNEILSI